MSVQRGSISAVKELVFAARSSSGRWHAVVDGHPACSRRLEVDLTHALPVGRAPARPRCHRRACKAHWSSGMSPATAARENMQRIHAREGLDEARWTRHTERREMWRQQGWLEPHVVYVAHLPRLQVFRVGLTSASKRAAVERQIARAGGALVDQVTVENRHAATLTKLDTLVAVEPWRRELPPDQLKSGGTEVWRASGPTVDLAAIAASIED